jgi:inositol oxygenase
MKSSSEGNLEALQALESMTGSGKVPEATSLLFKSRSALHLLSIAESLASMTQQQTALLPLDSLCSSPTSQSQSVLRHHHNLSIDHQDAATPKPTHAPPTPSQPKLQEGTYRSVIQDDVGPAPGTRTAQDRRTDLAHQLEGQRLRRAITDLDAHTPTTAGGSPRVGGVLEPPEDESDSSGEDIDEATRRLLAPHTNPRSSKLRSIPNTTPSNTFHDSSAARASTSSATESPYGSNRPFRSDDVSVHEMRRKRGQGFQMSSAASIELFLRLKHARQTLDFARRSASLFSHLDKARLTIWKALDTLDELRDYESVLFSSWYPELDPGFSLKEHALQSAELCRVCHPEQDWMALCGLLHPLGKLLAHSTWGSQPQWAVSGESFPLGCRFATDIQGAQHFTANPDRRRRIYNSPLGIYQPQCGLESVFMSWQANEYLYLLLLLNETKMPPAALFILRHQKFHTLKTSYSALCSPENLSWLPLLSSFRDLTTYRKVDVPNRLPPAELRKHYELLISKYLCEDGHLRF